VYEVQGIGVKAAKKILKNQWCSVKGNITHIPFESGRNNREECNELLVGLKTYVKIVLTLSMKVW
jgi:hypothetical protein